MNTLPFPELRTLALRGRQYGLTMEFEALLSPADSPGRTADEFVVRLGFKPLGKEWRKIERSEAVDSLTHLLGYDLAYQSALMEQKTARFIAEGFVDLFSPFHSHFLTNGAFDKDGLLEWTPLSNATFDHGVVIFDESNIGIIWVQDED